MRSRSAATAIALVSVLVVAGCEKGAQDDAAPTPTAGESRPAAASASPSPGGPGESRTPEPGGSGGPGDDGGAASPTADGDGGGSGPVPSWGTARKDGEAEGADPAATPKLTAVRVTGRDVHDRVTFEFDGGVPAHIVAYLEPLHQPGSGTLVPVEGEHSIEVVLVGALPDGEYGGKEQTSGVREITKVGLFEGELRVGIGLDTEGDGRAGFRVVTEADRLHVDITHGASPV
ncbi:AMIN-like domain-containing (lipo)protein [Streptomyces barkulensis]|uniref:AMIN-like domain-containing (lipo)protein n=1 Tax=Streptomyces barkulensis TaxID=1257026 RepID=UPI000C6D432F|nr:hypothetical protein [Streptomyces barkulensis]